MKYFALSALALCLMVGPVMAQEQQGTPEQPKPEYDPRTMFDCDNFAVAPPKTPCRAETATTRALLEQTYRQKYVSLPEDKQNAFEQEQRAFLADRDSKCSAGELHLGPGTFVKCVNKFNQDRITALTAPPAEETPAAPQEE